MPIECIPHENGFGNTFTGEIPTCPRAEWRLDKIDGSIEKPTFDFGLDTKCSVSVTLTPVKVKGKQYARPFIWQETVDLGLCTIIDNGKGDDGNYSATLTGFDKQTSE